MNYGEAVRYLMGLGAELAAPRQPLTRARVAKFDLRNTLALAERMGRPHRAFPCVHVAGTNGKGSVAAMLESILRAAGLLCGLYTSPHLVHINERIRVGADDISEADFAQAFTRVKEHIEALLATGELAAHPTYFECLTAMAFDHFARAQVDFAVFEVGMGGRLDATNVVTPEVSVITQIDFDHENYLGHSIEQIAGEKAGIIKPGVPVVSAAGRSEARAVIVRRAGELDAPLTDVDETHDMEPVVSSVVGAQHAVPAVPSQAFTLADRRDGRGITLAVPLAGRYQLRNAATAVAAARILRERGFSITDDAIARGMASVRWPGRLERVQQRPDVYLDGTHNPAGARELLSFWQEHFAGRRIHLVYGAMRDKAVDEITGLLFPHATHVILTAPRQPRAISAEALAEMSGHLAASFEVVPEPEAALERAIAAAAPEDAVFATGSLYLVGDLRGWWHTRRGEGNGVPKAVAQAG